MSEEAATPREAQQPVPGLTNARGLQLERFPIRTRESGVTQSAWRLSVACDQGEGAIVLAEVSPQETSYRGEGLFLGWGQEEMRSAYEALRPRPEEPSFELHQLG